MPVGADDPPSTNTAKTPRKGIETSSFRNSGSTHSGEVTSTRAEVEDVTSL
jgi:hypothetical protein